MLNNINIFIINIYQIKIYAMDTKNRQARTEMILQATTMALVVIGVFYIYKILEVNTKV
jgi:hypothetical protein